MADRKKSKSIQQTIQEALEKLGDALGEWVAGNRPQTQPVPVPVDRRPYGRRKN